MRGGVGDTGQCGEGRGTEGGVQNESVSWPTVGRPGRGSPAGTPRRGDARLSLVLF